MTLSLNTRLIRLIQSWTNLMLPLIARTWRTNTASLASKVFVAVHQIATAWGPPTPVRPKLFRPSCGVEWHDSILSHDVPFLYPRNAFVKIKARERWFTSSISKQEFVPRRDGRFGQLPTALGRNSKRDEASCEYPLYDFEGLVWPSAIFYQWSQSYKSAIWKGTIFSHLIKTTI